jgi:hypothetical protein
MSEDEDLRGIPNTKLGKLSDMQLLMAWASVMMGALGVEDEWLDKELIRRARREGKG